VPRGSTPNLATLGAWLDREGFRAETAGLRRVHPRAAHPAGLAGTHRLAVLIRPVAGCGARLD